MYWICKKHDKSGNIGMCPDCETEDMLNELKTKMKAEQNSSQLEPQVMLKLADIEKIFDDAIGDEQVLVKCYRDNYYGEQALVRIAGYRKLFTVIKSKFSA